MLLHFLAGLAAQLSVILAVGPQNAFVLRQGLIREHVVTVVAICTLGDVVLITAGNLGVGALILAAPWALEVLRWAGTLYLLWFSFQSFRSAFHPGSLTTRTQSIPLRQVVATTLAITFLNPAVYLDTVATLGTLAHQFGEDAWLFSAGAILGSVIWFTALGFGARALAPFVASIRAWRIIDTIVGTVILALAIRLIVGA